MLADFLGEMEIPLCSDPSHAGGRVVRAGWYGKPPHRRQRWLCRPPNGDRAHRFCEVLPRQATAEHYCVECSTRLERWEGQAGAREYLFSAREVGKALALVAGGFRIQDYARGENSGPILFSEGFGDWTVRMLPSGSGDSTLTVFAYCWRRKQRARFHLSHRLARGPAEEL